MVVSFVTFLLWDFIIPTTLYGISATGAMAEYWGVQIGFSPESPFFFPKIGIICTAIVGGFFVLRMVAIREGWSLFGFRDKYLKQLQKEGLMSGTLDRATSRDALASVDGANLYNYTFIEAFALYGFVVFFFQGTLDPLISFSRYVSVIIPFFASLSILMRRTSYMPFIMFLAIVATIMSNVGVTVIVMLVLMFPSLTRIIFPAGLPITLALPPDFLAIIIMVCIAFALFIYYYKVLPGVQDKGKPPDLRKIIIALAIASVLLMFFDLYLA
jgi:hypothetical protein